MMTRVPGDELSAAIVLRCELLADGLTDSEILALVRRGQLHRVRHGAYVDGALWARLSAADRHRVLLRAVLRRAHPSSVVSHVSAAIERGVPVWNVSLDEVHLTRTDGKNGRREAGVVHHRGRLEESEVELVDGVRLVSAARCAVEVTTTTSVAPALVVVNGLLHAGLMTEDELTAEVARLKLWPDTLATTIVHRLADRRVQSVAESRTVHLCWSQHLPRPEPQVPVLDEHGWVFAYTDFAWPEHGVFLEFDGRIKYEQFRREGETVEEYVLREKRREERICMLTGWVCIRITWDDLAHPERTARRIRRVLESRRRAHA